MSAHLQFAHWKEGLSMMNGDTETFLFTSESVGEGHAGKCTGAGHVRHNALTGILSSFSMFSVQCMNPLQLLPRAVLAPT